ncbi:MAG: LemA family protein [Armatimonadota bacterium]|nr:LemA family protein [Armatimonadota bacterium]MDR7540318.1 LemA family protein [Armatimonadota bacterium]
MTYVLLAVVALFVLYAVYTYNRLIVLRNRIDNAWSQIDVQLRRRYDLIANLVETVKGYAAHERQVFQQVTEARARAIAAGSVGEQSQAENVLTQALRSLFAVAENYPQLRASETFQRLQEELAGTESKIAFARQFYNDTVLRYENLRQSVPANLMAGALGFGRREYFEMEEAAREPVRVQF